MPQQKILIVDDEKQLTELISEALDIHGGYSVEKAYNGEEGLEKYKVFSPDLVVMDIDMPVMDGYESSAKIKSYDPGARILVLTGNPSDNRAIRTVKEGIALTLLKKPITLTDLNRTILESLPA